LAPFLSAQNNGRLIAMRRLAFALQAGAYAANDGQKMLAVLAVTAYGAVSWTLGIVAVLFALGTIAGLPAATRTLGVQVLKTGPREQITAQLSAAAAVFGSAALGAPVSMTQAVSGALVGTGMRRGLRQIRWRVAARLALAWLLTLPTSALVGLVLALALGRAL
ncbi:MAG: inorganic phosphate transporter, partial [Longimicrobiales bacterium]